MRRRLGAEQLVTPPFIVPQLTNCCWVKRNQSRLCELGIANREDSVLEIHVVDLESNSFADAQPGHDQKPKQAVICSPRSIAITSPRRFQQALDFVITVDIRTRTYRSHGDEIGWWHIGPGIKRCHVLGKASHHSQAFSWLCTLRPQRPISGQTRGDVGSVPFFQETKETPQPNTVT